MSALGKLRTALLAARSASGVAPAAQQSAAESARLSRVAPQAVALNWRDPLVIKFQNAFIKSYGYDPSDEEMIRFMRGELPKIEPKVVQKPGGVFNVKGMSPEQVVELVSRPGSLYHGQSYGTAPFNSPAYGDLVDALHLTEDPLTALGYARSTHMTKSPLEVIHRFKTPENVPTFRLAPDAEDPSLFLLEEYAPSPEAYRALKDQGLARFLRNDAGLKDDPEWMVTKPGWGKMQRYAMGGLAQVKKECSCGHK